MHERFLKASGVLLFATFGGLSGAFAGPVPVEPKRDIAAETCNACVSTCKHVHDMMMSDCANRRKYRTEMQVALCRAAAMREYGACLADCEHNKK
jgi:hypothetical protein